MKPLTDVSDTELAEIEARAAAATDVPWVAEACDVDGVRGYRIFDPSGDVCIAGNFDHEVGGIIERADAEFIARARTDVPRLAASLRAARAELAEERRLADIRLKRIDQLEIDQLEAGDELRSAWADRDQALARLADANTMIGSLGSQLARAQAELARLDPAKVAAWIAERDELAGQVATVEAENDHLRADRDFWKDQQKLAGDVAAGIADLDEEAPALRQLLGQERDRRKKVDQANLAIHWALIKAVPGATDSDEPIALIDRLRRASAGLILRLAKVIEDNLDLWCANGDECDHPPCVERRALIAEAASEIGNVA